MPSPPSAGFLRPPPAPGPGESPAGAATDRPARPLRFRRGDGGRTESGAWRAESSRLHGKLREWLPIRGQNAARMRPESLRFGRFGLELVTEGLCRMCRCSVVTVFAVGAQ